MFELGKRLLPGAGYLAPLGKEPENGQNRWFRRLAEGVFDEPNLIARTNELADFLIETASGTRRVAVGFSNGANIAGSLLLLRPEVLSAAALLAPMVPLRPGELPDLTGRAVLMVCGERDPIVPRASAEAMAEMLRAAGARLSVHWHSGGHFLGRPEWELVAEWLRALEPAAG